MRRPLPYTQRHEYPPEFRRQRTLEHVRQVGLQGLSRHPLSYARWEPATSIGVTLGLFLGLGVLIGFAARGEDVAFWLPVLSAAIAWTALVGLPLVLPHGIAGARRRRLLRRAVEALPPQSNGPGARPGQAGESRGLVTYHDGCLRVLTPQGQAVAIPFASIHLVEELPPKGMWGFPGIDVLTHQGAWTEIRVTDKTELVATLEQARVPVLRAIKNYDG
ncbi:hypothetical protein [Streptomyces litchfieldiae]|uniref:DUF304 domain-containing protein n=1 Tax=Streptomyces litchfieldiae TaxID=3075543 RepID=A0ABU2MNR5_9ACTN|nr:hypothetical protein [Streptomyces sp. DSM 44938]MDT0343096.1 hypothetical protein [Streptomyces sp. DSM 44938]